MIVEAKKRTCPTCREELDDYLFQSELNCMLCRNLNGVHCNLEAFQPKSLKERESRLKRLYGLSLKDYVALEEIR